MEDFILWLTLGHWPRCPCVEVFGLCLTLALRNHCPWRGGLWSLADLERCPLPLLRGLSHFGLAKQMVDQYKSRKESYDDFPPINATCHITQHADQRDKANQSRQKSTGHKQVRQERGCIPQCINLEMGIIFVDSWSLGCCYDDSCVWGGLIKRQ